MASDAELTNDERSPTLHAQGQCTGCDQRYLFLPSSGTRVGTTTETNEYCECDRPQRNVVTVVFDPDSYDLVDPYGDGEIGLRATCRECDAELHGPVTECPACGATAFDRYLEDDDQ